MKRRADPLVVDQRQYEHGTPSRMPDDERDMVIAEIAEFWRQPYLHHANALPISEWTDD